MSTPSPYLTGYLSHQTSNFPQPFLLMLATVALTIGGLSRLTCWAPFWSTCFSRPSCAGPRRDAALHCAPAALENCWAYRGACRGIPEFATESGGKETTANRLLLRKGKGPDRCQGDQYSGKGPIAGRGHNMQAQSVFRAPASAKQGRDWRSPGPLAWADGPNFGTWASCGTGRASFEP